MLKVGVGQVGGKGAMLKNSKKLHTTSDATNANTVLKEEQHLINIENLKIRLLNEFSESDVTVEIDKPFYSSNEKYFVYKSAIALQKENELVMVCVSTTAEEENRILTDLWCYCNHSKYFLLVEKQSMKLIEVPYSVTVLSNEEVNPFYTNTYTSFSIDVAALEKKTVEIEDVISVVKDFNIKDFQMIPMSDFLKIITVLPSYKELANDIEQIFTDIPKETPLFDFNNTEYSLTPKMERVFMECLLGSVSSDTCLYRYTSYKSLQRIFDEKRHSMASLAIMNDPTEVDYAQSYLNKHGIKDKLQNSTKDGVYTYITSLSEKRDDLTMWRLYGEEAKGISIEYVVPSSFSDDYLLANVSYADEKGNDSKLNFIAELIQSKIGKRTFKLRQWYLWQHFFKPYDYNMEKEVRLLFFCDDFTNIITKDCEIKWIQTNSEIFAPIVTIPLYNYPLKVKGILLGAKFPQINTNKLTLKTYIQELCNGCDDKYKEFKDFFLSDFQLDTSLINNYR